MKIESKKNNNINEESLNSLKDFNKKQILANIKYHKIFLAILFIINIGLAIFVIFYKLKINKIKSQTNSYTNQLNIDDEKLSNLNSILNHKIVNMASLNEFGLVRFSYIFETSDEFNTIKELIYKYQAELDKKEIKDEFKNIFLLFEGMTDNYEKFLERISYFWNLAIFFQTSDDKKFGLFVIDIIFPDKNDEFIANTKKIFMYSFETKKKYNYIGNGENALRINKKDNDKMIIVGDGELIIYNDYLLNGGEINFPMKSFDFSTVNTNVLTGKNGKFEIRNIEAFCFSYIQ